MSTSKVPKATRPKATKSTDASLLPPLPPNVPPDLTRATTRYKRHAWLAGIGLLAFVALYLGLTGWFLWTSFRLITFAFGPARNTFWSFVVGALSGLLGMFLLSALFIIKTGGDSKKNEITAKNEPELFAFLNALADRVGAPRPHRVFLSARVNAGVFYDISFVNLLIPTRKNLEIGLGLVNTLNLSEFTAVLAHEFGHFAQRSMAVGRWVYTAQQVAGQVVVARSWLDKLLAGLSATDFRIAWVGWLMRLIVWSIRSLLDSAFRLVVLAERALGREMEFQADLVSVSVTGSDALVHALHRMGAADGAWNLAINTLAREASRGKAVPDLFALQTRIIEHMGRVLNEPDHGRPPKIPAENPAEHRVFEEELAEPPRMWSTHPPSRDREINAKRIYVSATIDSRSAFCLFRDPERLRRKVTEELLSEVKAKLEPLSDEEALESVDKRFNKPLLNERYRGIYLARPIGLATKAPVQMVGPAVEEADIHEQFAGLYPETLAGEFRDLRVRSGERAVLEALRDNILDAPGGIIRHRGRVIPRRSLAALIEEVKTEVDSMRERVEAHDRACRAVHLAAAKSMGQGWEAYLAGLVKLHHYAAHTEANLEDAQGYLANVFSIVIADGSISSSERKRLIMASVEVHSALDEIYQHRKVVKLPDEVFDRFWESLDVHGAKERPKTFAELFADEFTLPLADEQNIGDWFKVIDSWMEDPLRFMAALERVSLEMLVEAEDRVRHAYTEGIDLGPAPEAPIVPDRYQTLTRDQKRERQKHLDLWDRFQIADGFFPSLGRLVVAGGILAVVMGTAYNENLMSVSERRIKAASAAQDSMMTILNGLELPIVVEVQGHLLQIGPHERKTQTISPTNSMPIRTRSEMNEEIETLAPPVAPGGDYIYNVAGATALVLSMEGPTVPVGRSRRWLGAPRWFVFSDEADFQKVRRLQGTTAAKNVRISVGMMYEGRPAGILASAKDETEHQQIIVTHAKWDEPSTHDILEWLRLAAKRSDFDTLLARRLERYPHDMSALLLQLDRAKDDGRIAFCSKIHAKAAKAPEDLDWRYLELLCDSKEPKVFLGEYIKHPYHPYIANAAAGEYLRLRKYDESIAALDVAASARPLTETTNLLIARLMRMIDHKDTQKKLPGLAEESTLLKTLLAFDSGEGLTGASQSFVLLGKGNLVEAVAMAKDDTIHYRPVLTLAAASEGAPREMIDDCMQLPIEQPQSDLIWVEIALRDREGFSHTAHDELAQRWSTHADQLAPFATLPFLKSGRAPVEAALLRLPIDKQAIACSMGLVRSAEHAPKSCRALVRTYLFVPERPYFRP